MRARVALAVILAAGAVVATMVVLRPQRPTASAKPQQADIAPPATVPEVPRPPRAEARAAPAAPRPLAWPRPQTPLASPMPESFPATTNKLERLSQIRESFHALAAGDPASALGTAKQITDPTEREAALLTLVTEWTQGNLHAPRDRARAIARFGLEAGLGMELTQNPELAVLWANSLTEPSGRGALLADTALALLNSDPAAAFALADQIPQNGRRDFFDTVFTGWARKDTDAALRWVDQLPDQAERDAALAAVRQVAPVGIGAALAVKDGYPVINDLVPGAPAQLSGQLHAGDRIVALAQGDNSFVDAHSLSLRDIVQMVRGAPGTFLQLQVLAADAPPNSLPRTVALMRDQVKFKN